RLGGATILPVHGRPFPGTLLLKVRDPNTPNFRLLIDGLDRGGAIQSQGAIHATLTAGKQNRATVTLTLGTLPDQDGDGVPDAIDDCPLPDPDQTCMPIDGGVADLASLCPDGSIF